MTTTTINPTPARRFDLPRVFAVLFRPRTVFTEMASESRATWSTPMIVLTITALLAVLAAGYMKTRASMMGEVALPPDWQYWTPDMQNNYMQAQQATQGPVFMYVMPLIGSLASLWFGWLVLAALLHLGSTLLGGRGSMQGALNTVGWSYIPYALRDLLRVFYMFLAQHYIASPSLSGFASGAGFLYQLLSRIDLFMAWSAILLIIGIAIMDGLPRGKSVVNVLVVVLLVLLATAGLGSLVSRLGGLAV